jgi:hypothetical protein
LALRTAILFPIGFGLVARALAAALFKAFLALTSFLLMAAFS